MSSEEHELLRNAVAAQVTVTSSKVRPTSTGDRYMHIEGRLGDDEETCWSGTGALKPMTLEPVAQETEPFRVS